VVLVAGVGLALVLLIGALGLSSAVIATHRARAAADLGALAAAQALQAGADPGVACAVAAEVTTRNGALPHGCTVADGGVVTAGATATTVFALPGAEVRTTTATARAGPSP
jgi:secretion/DNA translocation related TadE-like protein